MKAAFKDFASNVVSEKNLANQIGENFGEKTQKNFEITNSIYGQDMLSKDRGRFSVLGVILLEIQ